jgi:hypothetical protein
MSKLIFNDDYPVQIIKVDKADFNSTMMSFDFEEPSTWLRIFKSFGEDDNREDVETFVAVKTNICNETIARQHSCHTFLHREAL